MPDGDRQWFEELWTAHGGRVWAYVARRVGRQLADDVVADVFLVAWRRRSCARGSLCRGSMAWLVGFWPTTTERSSRRVRLVERIGHEPHLSSGVDDDVADSMRLESALAELSGTDRGFVVDCVGGPQTERSGCGARHDGSGLSDAPQPCTSTTHVCHRRHRFRG